MTISNALHALFVDAKLQTAVFVVAVDFVLGVLASLKMGTFRLSYIGDFGRNDILQKLVPWASLYIAAKFAGSQQLVIPGLDLADAAMAAYVIVMAAWTGSILKSINDLRLGAGTIEPKTAVVGSENSAPPKD